MPTCCTVTLTPFINQASSIVAYSGDRPTVSVSYLIDGVWQVFVASTAKLLANSVEVDHGGLSTGIIKFVQ